MDDLDFRYPALSDLRHRAAQRLPRFAFEYLDSATGSEAGARRNRAALDRVGFRPAILSGDVQPDLTRSFLGRACTLPLGVAPVGMSGLIWPRAEDILSRRASAAGLPFCLSTVSSSTPEAIAPNLDADNGWFQLYAPGDPEVLKDMLERVHKAGFSALVLTLDVPGESRRERQRRAHLSIPPQFNPEIIGSVLSHPGWALRMLGAGVPRMPFPEAYIAPGQSSADRFVHAGRVIRGYPDWAYLEWLRALWPGTLMVKGVQDPDDVPRLLGTGVDVLWVSNHAGRQFEAGPATIDSLPAIRAAAGEDVPIICDSGIDSGLDILRALARGADFVMLGRAFHYALGALGERGVDHLLHILRAD
ncbi:MAG: alpha-hydroxy acid oxidase, partial [Pseudomonadota bacterium]|nr:alpha-hydroxy acid oxidase [Pseudomonadota bacterium]